MESKLTEFLTFWESHVKLPGLEQDGARGLFGAYNRTLVELESLQQQSLKFIIPENSGKGFRPTFAPWHVDKVAKLASEIAETHTKLDSISQDIIALVAIVEGPSLNTLSTEFVNTRLKLGHMVDARRAAGRTASKKYPKMSLAELSQLPEILVIEENLAKRRAELEPVIKGLEGRLNQARAICDKYSVAAPAPAPFEGGYTFSGKPKIVKEEAI